MQSLDVSNSVFPAVPLIEDMFFRGVLPDCPYKPTYSKKGKILTLYQGVKEYVSFSSEGKCWIIHHNACVYIIGAHILVYPDFVSSKT